MTQQDIIQRLLDPGVIAIMRAESSAQLVDAARAMADGGITAMEVTMTTPGALDVIREVVATLGGGVVMGAGSVLDDVTARLAILAGAHFIVTPVLRPDVIAACRRYGKPVIAGAYTPTEALAAQEAGAEFVKLFPAELLGLKYIKALLAPLPQLRVIPTGGVDQDNCGDFLRAGCAAVAAGSSLAGREVLQRRDWPGLTHASRRFVEAARAGRAAMKS
jgi:2-dehydro-3-deoxyphosphogluconate aldolase/(4S)-4-hydroxy-2-oxoglutarate aldolase